MVAIGLLGDDAERNQSATTRWSPPTATTTGVPSSMDAIAADLADRGDTRGRSRLVGHSEGSPDGRSDRR